MLLKGPSVEKNDSSLGILEGKCVVRDRASAEEVADFEPIVFDNDEQIIENIPQKPSLVCIHSSFLRLFQRGNEILAAL